MKRLTFEKGMSPSSSQTLRKAVTWREVLRRRGLFSIGQVDAHLMAWRAPALGVRAWKGGPPDWGRVQQPSTSKGTGDTEEGAGVMRGKGVWADR